MFNLLSDTLLEFVNNAPKIFEYDIDYGNGYGFIDCYPNFKFYNELEIEFIRTKRGKISTNSTYGMIVEYDGEYMIMLYCDWFENNETHSPKKGIYKIGDNKIEITEVYKLKYGNNCYMIDIKSL